MLWAILCIYNKEMPGEYGVKKLHRLLNLALIYFYLAIYLEERHTCIGYECTFISLLSEICRGLKNEIRCTHARTN